MAQEGIAEAGWLHPQTVAKIYTSLLLYGNMGVLCWIILSIIQLNLAMSSILRGHFLGFGRFLFLFYFLHHKNEDFFLFRISIFLK
jgi:hypothetical protein